METMRIATPAVAAVMLLVLSGGCALTSEVAISPLRTARIERPDDLSIRELHARGEHLEVIRRAGEASGSTDLLAVGESALYAMRLDLAESYLARVAESSSRRKEVRDALWGLSRIARYKGQPRKALELAIAARDEGLIVSPWFLALQEALVDIPLFVPDSATKDRIPMRTTAPDLPRIDVEVEGRAVEAVIDSGASLSIITSSLADELDIELLPGVAGEIRGLLGVTIPVRYALVDSLRLGSLETKNVPMAILDDRRLQFRTREGTFSIRLLLGTDFLRGFRVVLDPSVGTLELDRVDRYSVTPTADQNLYLVEGRPMIAASLNRAGWLPMILDTGSEVTFLNGSNAEVRRSLSMVPRYHRATLQSLDGVRGSGATIENVEIGADRWAGRFRSVPLYSDTRRSTLGILGQNFIGRFRTVIDYSTMTVRFEPLD